jgi:hypothetical protein
MTTLYLSNKPSALNQDMITFLNTNIATIAQIGIYLNFVVADPKNIEKYTKQGIVNFPTLIYRDNLYVGVVEIKAVFSKLHEGFQKKQSMRTDSDEITDYWKDIISQGEDDNGDDLEEDMKNKAQRAVQERHEKLQSSKPGRKKSTISRSTSQPQSKRKSNLETKPVDIFNEMKAKKGLSQDDQLMADFFANRIDASNDDDGF